MTPCLHVSSMLCVARGSTMGRKHGWKGSSKMLRPPTSARPCSFVVTSNLRGRPRPRRSQLQNYASMDAASASMAAAAGTTSFLVFSTSSAATADHSEAAPIPRRRGSAAATAQGLGLCTSSARGRAATDAHVDTCLPCTNMRLGHAAPRHAAPSIREPCPTALFLSLASPQPAPLAFCSIHTRYVPHRAAVRGCAPFRSARAPRPCCAFVLLSRGPRRAPHMHSRLPPRAPYACPI